MRGWKAALEVARWEFRRYIKPRQQLVGMLTTFVIFGGFMMATRLGSRGEASARDIAIIGAETLPVLALQPPSLRFTAHTPAEEAALRERVRARSLDGLLIVRDADHAELVVRRSAPWTAELRALLAVARQQHMTARAGLRPDVVAHLLAPPRLELSYEEQTAGQARGERIALIVIVSLMLMAVFIGMSYIFASITGEKQIRVTEQIISAIPAQAWIDGKIVGLIGVSSVGVLGQVIAFLAVHLVLRMLVDVPPLPVPDTLGNPWIVALILLFAVLGLFFWFAFLGAVAATIDDPQHSGRGSLLFIPLFASTMAFLVLRDADSTLSRVTALLPPTAPTVMPVRLLLTDVPAGEIVLALALLIAAIMVLRVVAGRIFRLAMLMYGKEPSWAEVRRWALRG